MADISFYFDPVCPFAWMTSKWVRQVQAQRDYDVEWRFISLRLLNAHIDYASHFPPEYEAGHTAGLRLLRAAASIRHEHGTAPMDPLYRAFGSRIFETHTGTYTRDGRDYRGTQEFLGPILTDLGLPPHHVNALDDTSFDAEIQAETDEALSLTGRDVGTPIICFQPPDGVAFFGPVISRLPSDDDALVLWDHVIGLASFPGFAEIKRSLREKPQLKAFGVDIDDVGAQEDWHAGSRRTKK
ncbi:mycothiol-dependent nitroreductase Rv2466c family protein [Gordonia sp. NPDC003424]